MYIVRDFIGPELQKNLGYSHIKNTVIQHWDTKIVNGTKVFDVLYMYNRNMSSMFPGEELIGGTCTDYGSDTRILYNEGRKKLYKILGISKADLLSTKCNCLQFQYDTFTDAQLAAKSSFQTIENATESYNKLLIQGSILDFISLRAYIILNIIEVCPDKGKGVDYHDVMATWLYFNINKKLEGKTVSAIDVNLVFTRDQICKYIVDNTPLIRGNPNVIMYIDTIAVAAVHDINNVLIQGAYDRPVPIPPTSEYDSNGWYTNYVRYTKDIASSLDNSDTYTAYDPDLGVGVYYRDGNYTTNDEIISSVNGESFRIHYNASATLNTNEVLSPIVHPCLFVVLNDTMHQVFERQVRIISRKVVSNDGASIEDPKLTIIDTSTSEGSWGASTSRHYTFECMLEIKFRRRSDPYQIKDVNESFNIKNILGQTSVQVRAGLIDRVVAFAATLNAYTGEYFQSIYDTSENLYDGTYSLSVNNKTVNSSVAKQFLTMNESIHPNSDSALWLVQSNSILSRPYLKYDAVMSMSGKQFCEEIMPLIDSDVEMKNRNNSWNGFISFVLIVGAIIIAPYLMYYLGPMMGYGIAMATTEVLIVASATLAVEALALTGIALAYKNSGGLSQAMIIIGAVQFIGMASMALGGYAGISGLATSVINSIMSAESLMSQAGNAVVDYGKTAIASTSSMLNSGLNFLTVGFKIYSTYVEPANKGISELQDTLAAQEKELAKDTSSGDSIDQSNWLLNSPYENIYDTNEFMQYEVDKMTYSMTQGKLQQYYRYIL